MNRRHALLVVLTAASLNGCAVSSSPPSLPSPVQTPEEEPAMPVIGSRSPTSWRITPTSHPTAYSVVRTTTTSQAENPRSQGDSVTLRVDYSVAITRTSDSIFFAGSVINFDILRSNGDPEPMQIQLPFSFAGKVGNNVISTDITNGIRSDTMPCENISLTALGTIQHNIFLPPLQLNSGQAWGDSTSTNLCAGTLPINLSVVRTSKVIGEGDFDGVPSLIIDQNERTFSKGEGSQGQHRIVVEGFGITSGRIYLDRISGKLLSSRMTNQTTLSVRSSGRNQQFVENSTETTQVAH